MCDCEHVVVMNDPQSARQAVPSSRIRILAAENNRLSEQWSLSWTGAGLLTLNVPTASHTLLATMIVISKQSSLQEASCARVVRVALSMLPAMLGELLPIHCWHHLEQVTWPGVCAVSIQLTELTSHVFFF